MATEGLVCLLILCLMLLFLCQYDFVVQHPVSLLIVPFEFATVTAVFYSSQNVRLVGFGLDLRLVLLTFSTFLASAKM